MEDYYWCDKCYCYTTGFSYCDFCHNRRASMLNLREEYGPSPAHGDFYIRLKDGRPVLFHDARDRLPFYGKWISHDVNPQTGDEIKPIYAVYDYNSFSRRLGDDPNMDEANGVVNIERDGLTFRYTMDPALISELNRKSGRRFPGKGKRGTNGRR